MKQSINNLLCAGAIAILSVSIFSGCASIVSKSQYPVSIRSNPEGAMATVRDSSGQAVHSGVTPTTVTLKAGNGYFRGQNYTVDFQKEGFSTTSAEIRRDLNGWYLGNIIFGGLIGMLIVDPATGAMWRLSDEVHGELLPLQTTREDGEVELQILTLNDLPEDLREHLVLIN